LLTLVGSPSVSLQGGVVLEAAEQAVTTASSSADESSPAGALDGDRFDTDGACVWKGAAGQDSWWWQVQFDGPRQIGAILQVVGDHPRNSRNAPRQYIWQYSQDGQTWLDLKETKTEKERRLYRIHRLSQPVQTKYVRMMIRESLGDSPTVREVEFFAEPSAEIPFEDWVLEVSSSQGSGLRTGPYLFTSLKSWKPTSAKSPTCPMIGSGSSPKDRAPTR